MRGTRRDLLGQYGRDELSLAVEVERPLHADDHIIRGTEADRSTPDDASAFTLHDAAHGRHVEGDWRHGLHGVRRAGGGRDAARRRLWHEEPGGDDDRDDDHRRAVAGKPADGVLVDDDRPRPRQAVADIDHRAREGDRLGLIEAAARARGDEGRELDGRVAPRRDIGDDCACGRVV